MTKIEKPSPPPPSPAARVQDQALPPVGAVAFKRWGEQDPPMRDKYLPEWQAVLRDVGYPETVVLLDFETYYDSKYSLSRDEISTIEYIMDPRFEVLGVSVLEMDQPFLDYETNTHFWIGESGTIDVLSHLQRQYGDNLERCTVVAQNARFDVGILAFRYDIRPPHIIDTKGLAQHWNSRSSSRLKDLCKVWGLPEKGNTANFKEATFRKRMARATGRGKKRKPPKQLPRITDDLLSKLIEYANNDAKREWEIFRLLLPRMSNPATELKVMQHTLDLYLHPCIRIDEAKAAEITAAMEAEIDTACAAAGAGVTREEVSGNKSFEELLTQALGWAGDDPMQYTKPTKQKGKAWIFAIAKDDPARERLENHDDELVRSLIAARNAVKSWPLHIKRVDRIVRQAQAAGGYLPVPLNYHGAHTGRWSGAESINLQNLGSRGHPLISAIREMLLPTEDHEFVIADASQIEARVLAWLAGQDDLVAQFKQQDADPHATEDVYTKFASKVLGRKVRKPRKDGIPAVEDRHKWGRNMVGKVGVLGCGYGMGVDKMIAQNQALDPATAQPIVDTYREVNDRIVQFWHDLEAAFKYTWKYGKTCELRGLRFDQTEECDVVITLPSGRELKYHRVGSSGDGRWESVQVWNDQNKTWVHIWGGYLTENVVQAISRDILWLAIDRLEAKGYHTALHVHDELILNVPQGRGDAALSAAITALSTTPSWASGCPLAAEGVVTHRYGDH